MITMPCKPSQTYSHTRAPTPIAPPVIHISTPRLSRGLPTSPITTTAITASRGAATCLPKMETRCDQPTAPASSPCCPMVPSPPRAGVSDGRGSPLPPPPPLFVRSSAAQNVRQPQPSSSSTALPPVSVGPAASRRRPRPSSSVPPPQHVVELDEELGLQVRQHVLQHRTLLTPTTHGRQARGREGPE